MIFELPIRAHPIGITASFDSTAENLSVDDNRPLRIGILNRVVAIRRTEVIVGVKPRAAEQRIIAPAAIQCVGSGITHQQVGLGAADQAIHTIAAQHESTTVLGIHHVHATRPHLHVPVS